MIRVKGDPIERKAAERSKDREPVTKVTGRPRVHKSNAAKQAAYRARTAKK